MPDWRQIVEEHSARPWKTACRLLGNHSDASDCLQDAFMTAFQISRRMRVHDWGGLLQRLVARRAIDRLRQRYRSKERPTEFMADCPANGMSPDQCFLEEELAEHVRGALARLPEQQAAVFTLRYICGLEYSAIAQELQIETSHVGVLLHRARVELRIQLGAYLDRRPAHE